MGSTLIQGLGFVLVVLACTANDSLQTLGTFLVSNRGRTPLWLQVLWICLATAAILIFGWIRYHGDPAWDRLGSFPPPEAFSWFYLIPPLTIAVLTWWGAPSGTIQTIIRRKINIHDIRSATLIHLVFGMILFTRALSMSMIPLSTTWVFLGLLAGRELALVARLHQSSPGHAIKQLVRDLFKASVGVGVSIAVASSLQLVLM